MQDISTRCRACSPPPRLGLSAAVLLLVLAAGHARPKPEPTERPPGWAEQGEVILRVVREHFYDRTAAELWSARHAGYAARADSESTFTDLTRQALADLKASHTAFYTARDPEYHGLLAIFGAAPGASEHEFDSPGADFTPDHVVRVVFAGGPAAAAGLRRGDQVLQADGKDFERVGSFQGRAGDSVSLTVRRKAGEPPIEIRIRPRRIDPKREWLEAQQQGARLIERNGKSVAFVPMFSCAGEEYQDALHELLNDRLRDADALVLDFRDGWGGCNPSFLNLFNAAPPVLTSIARDGSERRADEQWRKPLFVLINGGSRSGKEAVAYSIRKHRLGTLVGERTAGAVLGGRCFHLSDRSLLYLAVNDVRVDGERLEGRGVEPDVTVVDALLYADGADPQLEKALDLATR